MATQRKQIDWNEIDRRREDVKLNQIIVSNKEADERLGAIEKELEGVRARLYQLENATGGQNKEIESIQETIKRIIAKLDELPKEMRLEMREFVVSITSELNKAVLEIKTQMKEQEAAIQKSATYRNMIMGIVAFVVFLVPTVIGLIAVFKDEPQEPARVDYYYHKDDERKIPKDHYHEGDERTPEVKRRGR